MTASNSVSSSTSSCAYNIYPKPQNLHYTGEILPIPQAARISSNCPLSNGIMARLNESLAKKNIAVDNQADFQITYTLAEDLEVLPKQFDKYFLAVHKDGISITAQTEAGLYYATTTLFHVLAQSKDELLGFELEDYATIKMRGIIEGYYGFPWGNKKRADVFHFTSYFKMNTYAFAPKDDPYHRDLWWELYPEHDLQEIADLARYAARHYINYVWTISPFVKGEMAVSKANQEETYTRIVNKFEQLYQAGVRQFGVLGDDVGDLPYEVVVYLMNKLDEWRKSKGDVLELLFCPQGYTTSEWAFKDGEELRIIDREFASDIHIFYTGKTVCYPLSDEAIDDFKYKQTYEGQVRRDPLFWMNWPVNDVDSRTYRRLFMGPGIVYERGVDRVTGVLTNPMEQPEASNVANFATLDFAWNPQAFAAEKSWQNSFTWIEPDAPEALHEICKHMSSQRETAAIEAAPESSELKVLADAFAEAYERSLAAESAEHLQTVADENPALTVLSSENSASLEDQGFTAELAALQAEYQKIYSAVDTFRARSKNQDLLTEMSFWLDALQDKAQAGIDYCEALSTRQRKYKDSADRYHKFSYEHYVPTLMQHKIWAEVGKNVINPNLLYLKEITDKIFLVR